VVVAVPVGALDACQAIAREADELVCLAIPEPFVAVGVHFRHFEPVEDEQVEAILRARS
jgi:predicted phosphoribosyltransferase